MAPHILSNRPWTWAAGGFCFALLLERRRYPGGASRRAGPAGGRQGVQDAAGRVASAAESICLAGEPD